MAKFQFEPAKDAKGMVIPNTKMANFNAKLISISDKVLENVNGTEYRVGTIEFEDADGKMAKVSSIIYEKNYEHGMETGKEYLSRVLLQPGQLPLITTSHLDGGANRATVEMFGIEQTVANPMQKA